MANKKLNQLVTKPSIGTGDLFPLADATTGQLYKTTISDLGTAIGSGVSSVNTLVGAVVLDTDDIQELASPVNKWYTDLRARAAISAGTGISYNSGTGVITNTITQYTDALARAAVSLTTTGSNGSATYNSTTGVLNVPSYTLSGLGGQPLAGNLTALAGLSYSSLGFIKMTGVGTLALDTNTYLTTSAAASTYVSGTGATGYYARFTGTRVISDGFIQTTSNITYVEGMGLSTLNGLDITGNYGAGGGGLKIRSYDETTGNAYIDFANTGGRMYLGLNRSTASGLMTNASAYATILTTGLGTTNLEFGTNATKRLTLDGTTGAATFTSTISATGATLTGALSGTSATFSGNLLVNGTTIQLVGPNNAILELTRTTNTQYGFIKLGTGATNYWRVGLNANSTNDYIVADDSNSAKFTISQSTGTATFSSSVTATGLINANSAASAANGSINIENTDPTIRFRVTSGTTDKRIYEWRAIAAGSTNDRMELRLWNDAQSSASNLFNITSSGNVGIGTTAPNRALVVSGANMEQLVLISSTTNCGIAFNPSNTTYSPYLGSTGNDLYINTSSSERMRITSGGKLLVNTTTILDDFTINGGIRSFGANAGFFFNTRGNSDNNVFFGWYSNTSSLTYFYSNGNGNVASINNTTGVYMPLSDKNKKKDFEESSIGLNEILQLKPTLYRMKSDNTQGQKELGFIAQEVKGIIPSAYQESKDFIGLNFNPIVAALTKAVQELKAELDTLKNK
jgi:hypothetical protein